MRKKIKSPKRRPIDDRVIDISVGPFLFNVLRAREAGWSEKSINKIFEQVAKLSRRGTAGARRAHPEWYRMEGQTLVFIRDEVDPDFAARQEERTREIWRGLDRKKPRSR